MNDPTKPPDPADSTAGERARLSEVTLVGRAQDGDVASFETLMRRYSTPVFVWHNGP